MTLRILVADGTPAASQAALSRFGGPTNAAMFGAAFARHAPDVVAVTVNVADGEALPAGTGPGDYDGVVLTGSPLTVYESDPAVTRQIAFARAVFAAGRPVWGSCWGLQLAATALGGTVRRNPKGRELGLARRITRTAAGRDHPLLAGRPEAFDALCSHRDEIETLPPGATVLAGNGVSTVQALAIDGPEADFCGVQYHPEHDFDLTAAILEGQAASLAGEGLGRTPDDLVALAADYRALGRAPARPDLAWRYGADAETLDPARRSLEIGNWLACRVRPKAGR